MQLESVMDGNRGMSVSGGVYDNTKNLSISLLYPCDQLALMIGLAKVKRQIELRRFVLAEVLYIAQGLMAVDLGLSHAQHVEVGAI